MVHLVTLGDSIASGETCVGCTLYPDQLAMAMEQRLGVQVTSANLAVPGAAVKDLVEQVRTDDVVREALSSADAILITIGFNDLAFNRIDDPCGAEKKYPVIDWGKLTHRCIDRATRGYRADLNQVFDEVDALRAGAPTMLRVTTVVDSVIGDTVDPGWNAPIAVEPSIYAASQMARAQCQVVQAHGGLCADTYHALNGPQGDASPQRYLGALIPHLQQSGQDAFAAALIALGFSPLGA